jgi:hypothetical protein
LNLANTAMLVLLTAEQDKSTDDLELIVSEQWRLPACVRPLGRWQPFSLPPVKRAFRRRTIVLAKNRRRDR